MTIQQEILTKLQMIHNAIESHPYLSGFRTNHFHDYLDDVVRGAHVLDDIPSEQWRKEPDSEYMEEL